MYSLPLALTLLTTTLTTPVQAQPALEPHQHGSARLQVVVEAQQLLISLHTPAVNLLGFEHKPVSAEEVARLQRLEVQLRDPSYIIQVPMAADCALSNVEIGTRHELTAVGEPQQSAPVASEILAEHSDLTVEYHYLCANPDALQTADVTLFSHFPSVEHLHAEVIGDSQSLQELSPANATLRF